MGSINFSKNISQAVRPSEAIQVKQAEKESSPEQKADVQAQQQSLSPQEDTQTLRNKIQSSGFEPAGKLDFQPAGMPAPPWVNTLTDIDSLTDHKDSLKASSDKNLPTGNQYFYHKLEEKINKDIDKMDTDNLEMLVEKLNKKLPSASPETSGLLEKLQDKAKAKLNSSEQKGTGMAAPDWVNALDDADQLIGHKESLKESSDKNLPTGNQYFYHKLEEKLTQNLSEMDRGDLDTFIAKMQNKKAEASPEGTEYINFLLEKAKQFVVK